MGDYIKELTIIDFLGMLVPGSVVIFILSMDYNIENFWNSVFGSESGGVVRVTMLIIMGYISGMIIHEIGDFLENNIWKIDFLNPKLYAIRNVGENKIKTCLVDKYLKNKHKPQWIHLQYLEVLFSLFLVINSVLFSVLSGILISMSYNNYQMYKKTICTIEVVILVILIVLLVNFSKNKKGEVGKISKFKASAREKQILDSIDMIECYMSGKGNSSKRRLFDGFRISMRNLILSFSIIICYYFICLGKNSNFMTIIYNGVCNNLWNDALIAMIMGIIICRYIRFTFLKYKYLFEDYIELSLPDRYINV